MDKTLYTEDSIESLEPREFCRLRPGVYCGSTEDSTQLLIEAITNSIDEYRLGHGDTINVIINGDTVSVQDFGQGFIPNSFRPDGKTILEASFSVLNTSGKYREDGTYEGTAAGLNGIGSKLINFLSHYMIVSTVRDGVKETIRFEEGLFSTREVKDGMPEDEHGTTVTWQPSEEFFTSAKVDLPRMRNLFSAWVCLCQGLGINLIVDGKKEEFKSQNGLSDLIDSIACDKEILDKRFFFNHQDGKNKIELAMTYTSNYSSTIVPYVNIGLTESGPHITQIKTLITRTFNKFLKGKGILKAKDANLSGDDVQEGMCLIFSITASGISYDAQTKSRVVKIDMKPFLEPLGEALSSWMEINEKEINAIAGKAIDARKAREAAKKARERVRQPKDKKQKLLSLPTKLLDCWSKKRLDCELLITEGNSAANGLVDKRDKEFQAVFPIRGKIINSYKASQEKVFANQEVVNIVKALGLDLDKDGKLIYDANKLRYGKIIMCADAGQESAV